MAFIRPYEAKDKQACGDICIATLPPSLSTAPDPRVQRLAPYVWTHQFTFLSPETCHVLDDGRGTAIGYCIGCVDVEGMRRGYGRFVEEVLIEDWKVGTGGGGLTVVDHQNGDGKEGDGEADLWRGKGERAAWSIAGADGGGGGEVGNGMVVNYKALEQLAFRDDFLLLPPTTAPSSNLQETVMTRPLSEYRATMHIDLLPPFQGQGWGRKLIDTFVKSVQEQARLSQRQEEEEGGMGMGKLDYGAGIWIGVSPENRKVLPFYDRVGFKLVMNSDEEGIVLVRDIETVSSS